MTGGVIEDEDVSHVPDIDVQNKLNKLKECKTDQEFCQVCRELADWGYDPGCPQIIGMKSLNQRTPLRRHLIAFYLFYRVKPAIDQFTSGMNSLGDLFTVMGKNPTDFQNCMCGGDKSLTRKTFKSMYRIQYTKKEDNKAQHEEEKVTMLTFERFLQSCENQKNNITINDVLQFCTGLALLPPQGLNHNAIVVKFYDQEEGTLRLPSASTCALWLWLPRNLKDRKDRNKKVVFDAKDFLGQAIKNGLASGFNKI
ncbi:uncharacterized protein LOC135491123 [Lineus longissimus]|uniref:uncharacterized protein LOC135491123 n=1 Tax=Lineus longissimus TaxID=88925 RepID=UPI00315D8C97